MKAKIFSTPTCPWCRKTKEYLDKKGVEYEDHDVTSDQDAAEEMKDKSGQRGVPVTVIGEKVIIGFDKDALDRALALL